MKVKVWCETCAGDGKNLKGYRQTNPEYDDPIPIYDNCPDCKGEGYTEQEFVRLSKDQDIPLNAINGLVGPDMNPVTAVRVFFDALKQASWMKVEK